MAILNRCLETHLEAKTSSKSFLVMTQSSKHKMGKGTTHTHSLSNFSKIPHYTIHKSYSAPLILFHLTNVHAPPPMAFNLPTHRPKKKCIRKKRKSWNKQLPFLVHHRLMCHTPNFPKLLLQAAVTGVLWSKSKWDIPFASNTSVVKRSYSEGI